MSEVQSMYPELGDGKSSFNHAVTDERIDIEEELPLCELGSSSEPRGGSTATYEYGGVSTGIKPLTTPSLDSNVVVRGSARALAWPCYSVVVFIDNR